MPNEKTVDSLGRRLRFSSPQDDGKRLVPGEADYLMFEWLDDHGPLPTIYLYEATKHLRQNYTGHQKRLGKLFIRANTPDGGRYLIRPAQQRASYRADRQDATHDNSQYARYALQNRAMALFPTRFDPMHHRFMNACVTASVRLAAMDAGLEFVTFKTILGRHTCPPSTKTAKNPLAITTAKGVLIPDDLTGLAYPTEPKRTYRFIAWEQDRATETLDAIELKLACYLDVLRKRSYEGHWGVPNLFVAIVTTRLQRMRNIIDLLERMTKKEPELREFFLFKFRPEFSDEWVTPPIMKDLLTDPWSALTWHHSISIACRPRLAPAIASPQGDTVMAIQFKSAATRQKWLVEIASYAFDVLAVGLILALWRPAGIPIWSALFIPLLLQLGFVAFMFYGFLKRLVFFKLWDEKSRIRAYLADFKRLRYPVPEDYYHNSEDYLHSVAMNETVSAEARTQAGMLLGILTSQKMIGPRAQGWFNAITLEKAAQQYSDWMDDRSDRYEKEPLA